MNLAMSRNPKRSKGLRPELELTLCCVRTRPEEVTSERIRALLRSGLNFDEIVADAIQNGVAPVMNERIIEIAPDLISPAQRQLLIETVRATAAKAMGLTAELVRLYQRFEAAQIAAIPYKGPVLATIAYGNVARRDYTDLDIVLQQRYIPEATALLQAAGYVPQFDPREAHAGEHGFAPGQYLFISSATGTPVELHTERTLRYFPTPLDFQELAQRLIRIEIGGVSVQTFSIEDTLVMLCVHGTKHFWERILWVLDVAKMITVQEVDWNRLLAIAEKMKSTRVLLLGLYLAHDLLGAPLPELILQKVRKDGTVRKLAEKVNEQYTGISDPSAGVWPRAVFRLRSSDSIGQGMRHLLRLAMSPTETDREAVRLPGFLSPLYVLVRPWRLAREYGLGLKRKLKPDLAIYDPTPPEIVDQMLRPGGGKAG